MKIFKKLRNMFLACILFCTESKFFAIRFTLGRRISEDIMRIYVKNVIPVKWVIESLDFEGPLELTTGSLFHYLVSENSSQSLIQIRDLM